ncbi:MAG TPA: neutral/alkaline non-lysosomal ceramidase N-terminal domain-containing protein, partial [Verrucomicrobiae bacterium]|nr:neutral/alkaline non-lysosomal ceramidase N-terminal domain-containing protein [Verrucomicrobiae bacterium]
MRRPLPISRGLVFALFFLVPASGAFAAEAGTLRAGAAKSEITPAAGTPLSGYGKLRGKKTRGTHDPLFARSLAFSRGDKTFLITSLDLCLVDEELRAAVLRKIHEKRPLAPENFVLTATHTHSGAGAVGGRFWERFIMGKFEKKVFEALTSAAAESGVAALDAEVPVRAEYAQLRIDDLVENRMIPKLRYPQFLKILRFKDGKDAVAGQLLFMAAHPTVFPAKEKMEFSADYPGVLAAALEEKTGGAVSVFVNGAAGDLRPHLPDGDDKLSKMTAYGRALAEKTAAASFSPAGLEGPWEAVLERVKLPRTQVRISGPFKIPSLIGNRFFPRKTFFQGLRLGDFVLLTFPGEITSEIGHEIEAQAAESGLRPLLAGYANDYLAYVVPRRYYRDMEQYESRVSFYGKDMAWFAQKKMLAIADKLLTAEEKAAMEAPGTLEWQGELPVLLLHGSAYHQGFEEGRLMKDKIHSGVDGIFGYFRGQIPVPLVNRLIIRSIGNRAWKKMEPYVSYEEYETIRGLSDGSGVSLGTMKRIHALPELFPALCTNGAYWGKATADGRLIALRNLDWNREMGVHKLAAIKFHDSRGREDFVN